MLLISVASATLDHRMFDASIQHLGLLVHLKDDRISKFLLVGTQRTKHIAEVLGQHRNGAIHQIDRSSTLLCLLVND